MTEKTTEFCAGNNALFTTAVYHVVKYVIGPIIDAALVQL